MNGALLVENTHARLSELVRGESRGHGDSDNALRRVANHLGIPYSYLWRILYRRKQIKDVAGSALLKIHLAHEAMRERRRIAEEGTDKSNRLAAILTRVSRSIAGEDMGSKEGSDEE